MVFDELAPEMKAKAEGCGTLEELLALARDEATSFRMPSKRLLRAGTPYRGCASTTATGTAVADEIVTAV